MPKSSRSNSSQPNVARALLVATVWVFVAFLLPLSAFAETLYVSATGKDGVKFGGTVPSEFLLQSEGSLQNYQTCSRVGAGWRPRLRRRRDLRRNN